MKKALKLPYPVASISLSLKRRAKTKNALSQASRKPGPGMSTWDQVWFLFPSQA